MPVLTKPDIKDFAIRVERLCDFLIDKRVKDTGRDGSSDLVVLERLKEDAAYFHFEYAPETDLFDGLDDYIRGIPNEPSSRGDQ